MKESSRKEKPKYVGDGVAVWVCHDKNQQPYLYIKVLNSIVLKAWKYKEVKEEIIDG